MKTNIYISIALGLVAVLPNTGSAQTGSVSVAAPAFDKTFWTNYATRLQLSTKDKQEFLSSHERLASQAVYNNNPLLTPQQDQQLMQAGPCVNIDFENGSLVGWNTGSGFHPLFNPLGCCPNPGGQQAIMQGNGLDPAGNFPIVAPGGNFSLRLGDNVNGGEADMIEQTFMVSPNNANFTYRYAVVFQDPGHTQTQQPAFRIEMLDSNNVQIPCTYYNVTAGQNIPGFMNSQNVPGVVYKPWSSVMVDLTNYIGQNVTIRFSTFDCSLGGHYGYAYIDGSCQAFVTGSSATICTGASTNFCAPQGLGTYVWNGPGVVNVPGQCTSASAAGIYTCNTTLLNGCTGPQFTYTLINHPDPIVSFNTNALNACAQQYTFTNTSSIPNGIISNYSWNFGGNNTSNAIHPIYTFPASGTYPVTLTATSNQGCSASATQTIAIYPNPVAAFTGPNTCQNAIVNFTNTSTIQTGSITSQNWFFGNGLSSSQQNPTQQYNQSGTYNVSLTVTSNQGCTASISNSLTIHPLPNVVFTSNTVCQGNATSFNNLSNILTGNIQNYVWDLDNNGQPDNYSVNPTHTYPTAGSYTVVLTAVSNYNCVNSTTGLVNVFANPTSSFTVKNSCLGEKVNLTNNSTAPAGGQLISYAWNFGNGSYSGAQNTQVQYGLAGNYSVQLTVMANNGCSHTSSAVAIVHPLPSPGFAANHACHNQATQFNNLSYINNGMVVQYKWDFDNNGTWDDTLNLNPSKVYATSGSHVCKLMAVSNNNCKAVFTGPVMVHTNPVADFRNVPVCLGGVSNFTNTSSSTDGAITSYEWDFDGDNNTDNILKDPSYTYTINGTYMLKLEVQTEHGCVNSIYKSMYVNASPLAEFAAPSRSGCPQFCVTFTNNSSIANGKIVNAFWNFGDGSPTIANMNSPAHCYNTGNYNVVLTVVSDSGCRTSITKPSYIRVFPKPIAGFRVEQDVVDENNPVIDVVSEAKGADQTMYYINDNNFSTNAINFHYTFKNLNQVKPAIYQVVKNHHGCSDTTMKVLDVKPSFAIFVPNTFTPNGDGINDGWFAKGVGIIKYEMQVYDRWGHRVFETNVIDQEWNGTFKGSDGPIKQDVYVWRAIVTDVFNRNHELTGTVTLLP